MNTPILQPSIDPGRVKAALEVLHSPGDVFEVRALEAKVGKAYRQSTVSGYFDSPEQAALSVQGISSYSGIYVTLNPVIPELLARVNNRLKEITARGGTTADKDVTRRRWMLIDCDPIRASGISSTDDEHRLAIERAAEIEGQLTELGWPAPLQADSGNGAHLLYRVDLPNDEASGALIKGCLSAIDHKFGGEGISIDQTVYNASRIVKLYGTRSQKGDATESRPHRMSMVVAPDSLEVVPLSLLQEVAGWAPVPVVPVRGLDVAVGGTWTEDRLDAWLRERGVAAGPPTPWQGKSRRIFDTCPLCLESDKSAAVFIDAQGVLGFKCHHNRCAGKGWVELREALEPKATRGPQMVPGVDISGILSPAIEMPEDLAPATNTDPGPIPESMLEVPGFIRDVMAYTLDTAPYPNKVLAFAGALSLLATLAGRKVRDPGDNRTNLYILGLALSGAGKDRPRQVNVEILSKIGLAKVLSSRFASGEGLEDSLISSPVRLCQTDEIDGLLQAMNRAKDARYEALMGALLTMYSSSATEVVLRQKAGDKEPATVDQPCLVMFGTAIPNHYYGALSERMLTNGLVARMLILECGTRGKGRETKITPVPERILQVARWWKDAPWGHGNMAERHPEPRIVPFTREGVEVVASIRVDAELEYAQAEARGDDVGTTVWARVSQQVRKLALLYAISRDHECPEICGDAVIWASSLVTHQVRRMLAQAEAHVAETSFEVEALKVVRKVRAAGGRIAHQALLKRMHMKALDFEQLMKTLEARGDLVKEVIQTSGRYGTWYRLPGRQGVKEGEAGEGS